MKKLKQLLGSSLLVFLLFGMNSCTTIQAPAKTKKDHPVFKVHPKNNGKKKGHDKHKKHQKHKKHGDVFKFQLSK